MLIQKTFNGCPLRLESRGLPDGENMSLWQIGYHLYTITLSMDGKDVWYATTNDLYVAYEIYKLDGSIK